MSHEVVKQPHKLLNSSSLFNMMQRNEFDKKFILKDVRPQKEFNECHIWKSQRKIKHTNTDKRKIILISSNNSEANIVSDFIFCDLQIFKQKYGFLIVYHNNLSTFRGMNSSMFSYPNKILSNLYLGNCIHSGNRKILIDLKITNIINVTRNMMDSQTIKNDKQLNVEYLRIPITDSPNEQIETKFKGSAVYIDKILADPRKRVLIHCQHGISRSSAILIAYLIWKRQWSYDETFKFVKNRRNTICPNKGFVMKLKDWSQSIRNRDTVESKTDE